MKLLLTLIGCALISSTAFAANPHLAISGLKYPNSAEEGDAPVEAEAWVLPPGQPTGFTELIPYFLRAPNQLSAGSCLYMSLTGIAEFWIAKQNAKLARTPDGPVDLSERYVMNVAGRGENRAGVANWKTDTIFVLNNAGGVALNSGYRFTKGWTKKDAQGDYAAAPSGTGSYSASYNWIDQHKNADPRSLVSLPKFDRQVLYADPKGDQWNVGVMPNDIVERIKTAMRTRKAPVHVIYNHFGYWHAVAIAGFDDDLPTRNCAFVSRFRAWGHDKPRDLRAQAANTKDSKKRASLIAQAVRIENISRKVDTAYAAGGGCHPKGMFYVRDSIYADGSGPQYDYDLRQHGDEAPYTKTMVMHEYDWVRYMANHATVIYLR